MVGGGGLGWGLIINVLSLLCNCYMARCLRSASRYRTRPDGLVRYQLAICRHFVIYRLPIKDDLRYHSRTSLCTTGGTSRALNYMGNKLLPVILLTVRQVDVFGGNHQISYLTFARTSLEYFPNSVMKISF